MKLPPTVWRLMFAYALMMSGASLMVLIAGLIGLEFAPHRSLATLPVACTVVGLACSTLPTGRLLEHWGRRRVFIAYALLAILAALTATASLVAEHFVMFCAAAFGIGWAGAAGHQYRFAALESVAPEQAPRATAMLLLGGLLAAAVGPEIAVGGRDLLGTPFAGSYLLLAVTYGLGVAILSRVQDSVVHGEASPEPDRPLGEVLRAPVILLAVATAAVAYGVMSFVMTASPISMHEHGGHDLQVTKRVIQSHIIAMYLPSLFFATLYRRFGYRRMMLAGALLLVISVAIALGGLSVAHYWTSMVMLGLGWNFLFLTATNLLPLGYRPRERYRVQSVNDFAVFTVQAVVSLGAGWFLFRWRWDGLLYSVLPLLGVYLLAVLLWSRRIGA